MRTYASFKNVAGGLADS